MKKTIAAVLTLISINTLAQAQTATAYNCKLVNSRGGSQFERKVFATEGVQQAKLFYLNSLIVKKDGTILEPREKHDGIELGIPSYPPKLDEVAKIDCISAEEINLSN